MTAPLENKLTKQKSLAFGICLFLLQTLSVVYGSNETLDSLRLVLKNTINPTERLSTLIAIGDFQETQSFEYREAYMSYEEARKLSKKNQDTLLLGEAVYRQAKMLMAMGEIEVASEYFDAILGVSNDSNFVKLAVWGHQGKGLLYLKNGDYKKALHSFGVASQLAENIEDATILSELYYLQSKAHYELQNFDRAKEFLELAETSWKNSSVPSKYILLKGQIAYDNNQILDAISYYKKALMLAENNKQFVVQIEGLQLLINFYKKQKQWEEVVLFEDRKNHLLNAQPNELNKNHLAEIIYSHAYSEVRGKKKQYNRNQVMYAILITLLLLVLGVYIIKKQRASIRLTKSIKEAQTKFVQERYDKYTSN